MNDSDLGIVRSRVIGQSADLPLTHKLRIEVSVPELSLIVADDRSRKDAGKAGIQHREKAGTGQVNVTDMQAYCVTGKFLPIRMLGGPGQVSDALAKSRRMTSSPLE